MIKIRSQHGFTLIEMAIVLVILGFLLGGVLSPLAARQEQDRRDENAELLEKAREALIGFALVNGRLPCPDTDAPGSATSGQENEPCGSLTTDFHADRLPWVTLGVVGEFDAWGAPDEIRYAVSGPFTDVFALDTVGTGNGIINIHNTAASCGSGPPPANLVASGIPALIWSTAKTDYATQTPVRADEAENDNDDRCYVYREYSSLNNQEFDDQMVWLSPNVLFNRMIEAGVLP